MASRPARLLITIVMDVLIVCAVAVTVRLGVRFFGQLSGHGWGKAIVAYTHPLVIPFGFHAIKTPYGGVFDTSAALMIVVFLAVEWVIAGIRTRA